MSEPEDNYIHHLETELAEANARAEAAENENNSYEKREHSYIVQIEQLQEQLRWHDSRELLPEESKLIEYRVLDTRGDWLYSICFALDDEIRETETGYPVIQEGEWRYLETRPIPPTDLVPGGGV